MWYGVGHEGGGCVGLLCLVCVAGEEEPAAAARNDWTSEVWKLVVLDIEGCGVGVVVWVWVW